jgi:hypothetical protein
MRRSKVEFHVPVAPKFSVRQKGELQNRESSTCGQSRNSGGLDGAAPIHEGIRVWGIWPGPSA